MSAKAVIVLALVGLFARGDGKTLSHRCSGWTPEDCNKVKGCMNCFDGQRVDCFPENSSQLYGKAEDRPRGISFEVQI